MLDRLLDLLVTPEVLTPSQYADMRRSGEPNNRELAAVQRLMFAVLKDAIRCYGGFEGGNQGRWRSARLAKQAEAWIFDEAGVGPFAFQAICEALGYDGDAMRAGLEPWRKKVRKRLGRLRQGLGAGRLARRCGQLCRRTNRAETRARGRARPGGQRMLLIAPRSSARG